METKHNLPYRAMNSPLMKSVNFEDGSFVNLIKLNKPYANGNQWVVYETTKIMFNTSKQFRTEHKALKRFNKMVDIGKDLSPIINTGERVNNVWITSENKVCGN